MSLKAAAWQAVVHSRHNGQGYTQYIDTYVMSSGRLFAQVEFRRSCQPRGRLRTPDPGPDHLRMQEASPPAD